MIKATVVIFSLIVLCGIALNIGCSCFECRDERVWQSYTVVNRLDHDVVIYLGNGIDPTGLLPLSDNHDMNGFCICDPCEDKYMEESGILKPGEQMTFENALESGYSYYVVEAKDYKNQQEGRHIFIRKFSWEDLRSLEWIVTIEPGYEEPSWGPIVHELTVRNEFEAEVIVELYQADNLQKLKRVWNLYCDLDPGQTCYEEYAVTYGYKHYVIQGRGLVFDQEDRRYYRGEIIFERDFSWDELESTDWIVDVEPGYQPQES